MNSPRLADIYSCTGCLACVDSCPKSALRKIIADDGHIYIECDTKNCVLCRHCEQICPVINGLVYSSNNLKQTQPYASYVIDPLIYEKSTSGGLFAAIAYDFINNGGFVCGAILQNNIVRHIISNDIGDIPKMQGSKYMQSDLSGIYRDIATVLNRGDKVLFCGMGCQAASMISFFHNDKNKNNLYVIDMICGGVPSALLVHTFLENERSYSEIISFRKKDKYVLSCKKKETGDIVVLDKKRTLPLYGFFCDLTKRYSCGDCKFCGIERLSDLTIGDYWGECSHIHKSVALAHTKRGVDFLKNNSLLKTQSINWDFLSLNYRCAIGYSGCNGRLRRKLLGWNFNHFPYYILCGLYGCNPKSIVWLPLTIYNTILNKILTIKKKRLLKKSIEELK